MLFQTGKCISPDNADKEYVVMARLKTPFLLNRNIPEHQQLSLSVESQEFSATAFGIRKFQAIP